MTILTTASSSPFPMEDDKIRHGTKISSPSKTTKGVGNMSEMKYKCVQGVLHCKVLANKIGIQYERLPGHLHTQSASERQMTDHNVEIHKNKIERHQSMIKENRIARAKANSEKGSSSAGPDSYLRYGTSP